MFADLIEAGAIPLGCTLEVGCGTGINAIYLAQHGFEVVGVDISPLAVESARESAGFQFVFDRGCFQTFDVEEIGVR